MNTKKFINNLQLLLSKNKDHISRIVVSLDFMEKLAKFPQFLKISEIDDDWFLFDVPLKESNVLNSGAILEMKNGEFIVLKGI